MTLPPIDPEKTTSGISVDPVTLDRVVAASRRPDGSMRKEIKIRPGFTPQEDVGRFRSQRQQVADTRKAGPRVVPGWAPPPQPAKKPPKPKAPATTTTKPGSGTGKKSEKQKAKEKEKEAPVKDSWEDEDEDESGKTAKSNDPNPNLDGELAGSAPGQQQGGDTDVGSLADSLATAKISDT